MFLLIKNSAEDSVFYYASLPLDSSYQPSAIPFLHTHSSVSVFSIKPGNASCLPERQDGSVALQSIRQLGLHGRAWPAESHFDLFHLLIWKVLDLHKLLIARCSSVPGPPKQLQPLQAGKLVLRSHFNPTAPSKAGRKACSLLVWKNIRICWSWARCCQPDLFL